MHNVKHYGNLTEDYLGYEDPNKELRKAVKAKEKAAKKARKAKKKKGGKKEDLFDPANLAKYKKELEDKRKAATETEKESGEDDDKSHKDEDHSDSDGEHQGAEGGEHLRLDLAQPDDDSPFSSRRNSATASPAKSTVTSPKEDKDDWKKFLNQTSGIVEKSKHDLEETKLESYYQPKETKLVDDTKAGKAKKKAKKKKVWVDLNTEDFEDFDGEVFDEKQREKELAGKESDDSSATEGEDGDDEKKVDGEEDKENEADGEKKPELFKEPSVEEYVDPDEDDALFNTDFVTDITTGKVLLAVIPDSPTYEDGDDDPFNTEIANVIVKKQTEEKKKADTKLKFTGLSAVADVLSGKSEKLDPNINNVEHSVKKKRRRANRINLIGEDPATVTAVEDIATVTKPDAETKPTSDLFGDATDSGLAVPEGDLLASTPSPCSITPAEGKKSGLVDLSEFEEIDTTSQPAVLTSNIAILAGEFAKPVEEEQDDFDAAFDALAQESVTKAKLDEFEKQFETEEDIFDTTCADKVLQLASLLDKVEDVKAEDEEIDETQFEDPFDTSAYDQFAKEVETELDFDSLGNRDTSVFAQNSVDADVIKDAGAFAFDAPRADPLPSEGWAAFDGVKPKRPPPPPKRPNRPPPIPANLEAPSVVLRCPSIDSIKSWNVNVSDTLIRKSEIEAQDALREIEEYDPFDTKDFEEDEKKDDGEEEFEDPFDTTAAAAFVEQVEEAKRQEELARQPVDLLGGGDDGDLETGGDTLLPTDPEVDPFDTEFAADVLPNKGDPFNTNHVKGDLGPAEIKALEDEFLPEDEFDPRIQDGTAVPKKSLPGIAGRCRPKGGSGELSVKLPSVEQEEEEEDPFDTSIVDKVVPVRRAEKRSEISVEDEEFDPSATFKKSKELESIDEPDPFDTSVAINALPEEERQAELEKKRKEEREAAAAEAAKVAAQVAAEAKAVAEARATEEEKRVAAARSAAQTAAAAARAAAAEATKGTARRRPGKPVKEPSPDISDDDFDPRG